MPKIAFENTYFAVTVRVWRKRAGLSLQELSELVTISVSQLSLIERDEACPTIAQLCRLCDMMDEKPTTFFRDRSK